MEKRSLLQLLLFSPCTSPNWLDNINCKIQTRRSELSWSQKASHNNKNKLLIYPKSQSWRPPMPKSFQLSWHGIGRRWQEQHGRTLETGGFSASFVLLPETFLHIGQITVKSYSSSGWRNRQCTATIRSRFLGILGYLHPNATSDHCKRGRGQLMNATMIQGFVSWFKPPRKTRYLHHACRITRWLATETSKINKIDE